MTPPAVAEAPPSASEVRLSEVLSALSHALDLTEGQPRGHTLRSCVIGMRLAEESGVGEEARRALYYALLLKDAGCSSNAARFASLFGSDDQAAKYRMKLPDWQRKARLAWRTARTVGMGRSLRARVRHFVEIARTPDVTRDLIAIRCDRGARIVLRLGFPPEAAGAVRALDEHWNGKGYPEGLSGEGIPLLARIANLAQTLEIHHAARGRRAAVEVAVARRGTWFDPRLVDRVRGWAGDAAWWDGLGDPAVADRVVAAEPGERALTVDAAGLDEVARAFADVIDAKSPYTFRHSSNVADYACRVAREMGVDAAEERRLYRAGLLHDVGKLGVSNRILDKDGPLTPDERLDVQRHPLHTWEILSRVGAFQPFARLAAVHHERLDGTGYPWGHAAPDLDRSDRVLAVADVYEALTADRPYRAGMPPATALAILHEDAPARVCPDAVAALESALQRDDWSADAIGIEA
ncbi:MAG TPA: HD domain-containing phosphohydrolase [Longimicrobium sp.]|nr:HD domain-containing phosphohydrolase [Longimicrobium sp.]